MLTSGYYSFLARSSFRSRGFINRTYQHQQSLTVLWKYFFRSLITRKFRDGYFFRDFLNFLGLAVKAVNYFRKINRPRCLTKLWICFWFQKSTKCLVFSGILQMLLMLLWNLFKIKLYFFSRVAIEGIL